MSSAASETYDWKILCLGRGVQIAKKAEEHLQSLGYKNLKVEGGIENNAAGDEKLISLLKEAEWDAVSFGTLFLFITAGTIVLLVYTT